MTDRLRIGSMPVENSSRKTTGVSTMKILATCTRRRKPPLMSWTFWFGLVEEVEVTQHAIGLRTDIVGRQAVEAGKSQPGCRAH